MSANHWLFLPILLPLLIGSSLLVIDSREQRLEWQRILSLASCALLLPISVVLLSTASDGNILWYALGNWPPPFGIVLVLDRLAALMLMLTALVALASLSYAIASATDTRGRYFHVLFQLQLFGLNGAFVTGDLFNLFVCFEILLIASYGLLLHGGGRELARAGLHYVVLNLSGSALFLIGIGILYGITGTLNMADLASRIAQADSNEAGLLRAGALLLLVVFALKAALLPLHFWLPRAYSLTCPAVAALFAIMTKVGVYAIVRVFTLIFGDQAGVGANVAQAWLLPLALVTMTLGAIGCLSARDLRRLLAYLVVVSVGTLLTAVGLFNGSGLSAAIVYLIHSTLMGAAMFILADLIERQRGSLDLLATTAPVSQPLLLGGMFMLGAIALTGLPPLSGFLAKLMIMRAADSAIAWVWGLLLLSGLFSLIAFSRSGSALFWRTNSALQARGATPVSARTGIGLTLPALILLAASPALVASAAPLSAFARATAAQLLDPGAYISAVLGSHAVDPDQ